MCIFEFPRYFLFSASNFLNVFIFIMFMICLLRVYLVATSFLLVLSLCLLNAYYELSTC